ncbi:MAG: hypothetical protein MUF01_10510, partial [Bryobacterales bacterium]|nr:hypothetical protein [Bryobacterales bacterium]
MPSVPARVAVKTLLLSCIVIVCQVGGNALLSWAMKRDALGVPASLEALLPFAMPEWMLPFFSIFL